MKVSVRLFAAAREAAGCERLDIELPDCATIGQLRQGLRQRLPQSAALIEHAMFAIDQQYASNGETIPPDADVACIPPVSGG